MKNSLGDRIKSIRLEKGYTMEDFGKLLKTSKGTVNNWEKGRNNPNRENLKKIAELGNTTVDDLLDNNNHLRIQTAKYIYGNLLTDYPENSDVGKALRYFPDSVLNELLFDIANKKLEISFQIGKNKSFERFLSIEDIDAEDDYYEFMKRTFVNKYQKEVKTNTNLIKNTAQQVFDITDPYIYKIYDWGETYYANDERYAISVQEVEGSINDELVNKTYSILMEAYEKIIELKNEYSDETPTRKLDFILNYEDEEHYDSKVIKSIPIDLLKDKVNIRDKNQLENYRIKVTTALFNELGLKFLE
ncbi:helix-turn-helix domain-containing protein [Vagococcus fluvialis]|uniref:helix-turn-helix domain-containing protein n=1 Tax=Vagococcus fluvialis TaxID=2738 RepID=UPI003B5C762C